MAVVRRILRVALRLAVGIGLGYLLLSLVVLPLAGPWVIRKQGKKLLGRTVKLRSLRFNPFLLRVTIDGFQLLDGENQLMAGFDRLSGDISFRRLFKKEYRIEELTLDGFILAVKLSKDGSINLLEVMPPDDQDHSKGQGRPAEPAAVPAPDGKPLPHVVLDLFHLQNGRVDFIDEAVTPRFATTVSALEVQLTDLSTDPAVQSALRVQAILDGKGVVAAESQFLALADPPEFDLSFRLNNYALDILTPYVGKYTAREVADGKLDVSMQYRVKDNQLTASHSLLIQRFGFGKKIESEHALNLPFGLAVALLEDPQGKIVISLPVSGDMGDPEFEYLHLVGQVVKNFFLKLITKPFTVLASLLGSEGGTEELAYVRFSPGESDLNDTEQQKLKTLIKGLAQRPRLLLEVNGTYDAQSDWRAISTRVFTRSLEQVNKESTGSETERYQILYRRRFGVRALRALVRRYRDKQNYDEEGLRQEIKRLLIEDGSPDPAALEELAGARAQRVYDFMVSSGIDSRRVSIGPPRAVQGTSGYVPLEFTLTVFEDSASGKADRKG